MLRFGFIPILVILQYFCADGSEYVNLSHSSSPPKWDPELSRIAQAAKVLDLSSNSISDIPSDGFFRNFNNLEELHLANNNLRFLKGTPFTGLSALKKLDLQNNDIVMFDPGVLFGLGKDTDVLVRGNRIFYIYTSVFEDPTVDDNYNRDTSTECAHRFDSASFLVDSNHEPFERTRKVLDKNLKAKVCIREGIVEKLEAMKNDEILDEFCHQVRIRHFFRYIIMVKLGIAKFSNGWYRLQDHPIVSLDLSGNNIVDVSSEMLNQLPETLRVVDLSGNKIERLVKGSIANRHLRALIMDNNSIHEIEDGTFENTNLTYLHMSSNRLSNTKFVVGLSPNLRSLDLSGNLIEELAPNAFSNKNKVLNLDLTSNIIAEVRKDSLNGLRGLNFLILSNNKIKNLEPGCFNDLKRVALLKLENNQLTELQPGVFKGLTNLQHLDLGFNKLTKVTSDYFSDLSSENASHMKELRLNNNQIEVIEKNALNIPKYIRLALNDNKIRKIENGAFKFTGYEINLSNNNWSEPNAEVFKEIPFLWRLYLANNNIKDVNLKNYLKELYMLNLDNNPIRELKNGALSGMRTNKGTSISLIDTPLEVIRSGVFKTV